VKAVSDLCPVLQSMDGGWRSVYASREHRCWAITPPAQLALSKQRQLCLTAGHTGCATYIATAGEWSGSVSDATPRQPSDSLLWPAVRATPLALEPSRGRTGSLPVTPGRTGGQALLVALMVLAFLVLVIARTTTPSTQGPSSLPGNSGGVAAIGGPSAATSSPAPVPTAAVSAPPATVAASGGLSSAPSPALSTTPKPSTAIANPTPGPTAVQRYTVKSGDTLGGIAARFGTTVAAIQKVNGISNPRLIRVGQVLIIP